MASEKLGPLAVLKILVGRTGSSRLLILTALMLASSLTEGIGLFLLIPITQSVAEPGGDVALPFGLGNLASWPLEWLLASLVALVAARATIVFLASEIRRGIGLGLVRKFRSDVMQAITHAEWRWLSARQSSDFTSLIVIDADRAPRLLDHLAGLTAAGVTLGILTVAALLISPSLTLVAVFAGLMVAALLGLTRSGARRDGHRYGEAFDLLQDQIAHGLQHLRAARIAGAETQLADQFRDAAASLERVERSYFRRADQGVALIQISAIFVLTALVYAAIRIFETPLPILVPIVAIFARAAPLGGSIFQGIRNWGFDVPALHRLLRIVRDAERHGMRMDAAIGMISFERAIALRGVGVQFDTRDRPALDNIDLAIPKGSLCAVIGRSGSGKSTLADVIAGLIEPDCGTLEIDDVEMTGERRTAWRRQVAYVEQSPYLFDGTIAENLLWGGIEASIGDMEDALRAASAGFVMELPDGLDTRVGEKGVRLSGGERQRLCIARAMMRDPELLILDEVTSALDHVNEAMIIETIGRLKGACTILALTHSGRMQALADHKVTLCAGALDGNGEGD